MLPCTFCLLPAFLDDVSRIRRSDISFKEGFMVIKVLKCTNDQLRKGDKAVISQLLYSPACPTEFLKRYLAIFQIPPDSEDLIFKPISRGKGCVSFDVKDTFSAVCEVVYLFWVIFGPRGF